MDEKQLYHVIDGSLSLKITPNGLKHSDGLELGGIPSINHSPVRTFEIIAEDCDLPAETLNGIFPNGRTNTIIRATDNGDIVFTLREFLRPVQEQSKPLPNCPYSTSVCCPRMFTTS